MCSFLLLIFSKDFLLISISLYPFLIFTVILSHVHRISVSDPSNFIMLFQIIVDFLNVFNFYFTYFLLIPFRLKTFPFLSYSVILSHMHHISVSDSSTLFIISQNPIMSSNAFSFYFPILY